MRRTHRKLCEDARQMFLSGEVTSNAEIARRLKVKPHTVARWRKDEDWDGLQVKVDRRAAELFVEKVATDRTSLNINHDRMWQLMNADLLEKLKAGQVKHVRDLYQAAAILERSQKGQRLARGMATPGETEEQIRAQAATEVRQLIDLVIDTLKAEVTDEETRDRIRRRIIAGLPEEEGEE